MTDINYNLIQLDMGDASGAVYAAQAIEFAREAESQAEVATEKASAATTSETNAVNAATRAATSETNAANSAQASQTSASNASASATQAAQSASAAATSASNAATSATGLSEAVTRAETAATNAQSYADNASISASNASISETNARAYSQSAGTYSTNAQNSASAAATSETNAANSASAANTAKNIAIDAEDGAIAAQAQAITARSAAQAAQAAAETAQARTEEVAESIPADYSTLSNDVTDLKSHFVENANLANPNTVTSGLVISSSGVETANSSYDTSDYISVEPGGKYSWKDLSYLCRYGADKNWLGRTSATSQTSITLAPTVCYVRVCGRNGTADTWRFNKGNSVIDMPYTDGVYLSESVNLLSQLDGVNAEIDDVRNDIELLTPTDGVPYIPSIPYEYNGESIVPYKTSGHLADIYALYDALCEQYPQYITKRVLGMDASGQYEVRAYRIDNGTNFAYRRPRIVWLSSIHGNEGNTTISTYYMVKEILEKFATDPVCYGIMSAVRLYVVPAVNPWGVENYSRLNANNVNLNRNFPVDWVYRDPNLAYGTEKYGIMSASNGNNPYYYYGGGTCVYDDATQTATTTYVAEPETQLIMDFIDSINTGANLNGKVCFAINKHDAGNMTEEGALVLIRDNYESDRTFLNNFLNWMKPQFMAHHNWLTEKSGLNLATVTYDTAGDSASAGTMDKWLNYTGIHGGLCEIPKGAGSAYSDVNHFSDLCAINVSVGLNMMNNVIVNNAKLKDNTETEQYVIVS